MKSYKGFSVQYLVYQSRQHFDYNTHLTIGLYVHFYHQQLVFCYTSLKCRWYLHCSLSASQPTAMNTGVKLMQRCTAHKMSMWASMASIGSTNVKHAAGRPNLIHLLFLSLSLKLNVCGRTKVERDRLLRFKPHGGQFKKLLIMLLEPRIFGVFSFLEGKHFCPSF